MRILWIPDFQRMGARSRERPAGGFTLVEMLIVVAIISLLAAIMIPSLRTARIQSRVVQVHSDLRQIMLAMESYLMNNDDKLPPTRYACGTNINYQLPIELAQDRYLPKSPSKIPQAYMADAFNPSTTYKYRAPGPIYLNGSLFDFPDSEWRPRANIWVPDDFSRCQSPEGRYYYNRTKESQSPVTYAVWSMGPDWKSPKFPRYENSSEIDMAKFPVPRCFWYLHVGDTGLITHMKSRKGLVYTSP